MHRPTPEHGAPHRSVNLRSVCQSFGVGQFWSAFLGQLYGGVNRDESCSQILAPAQQILAQLPIGAGEESGETLEVERQVAFMRKSDCMRNDREGPVRGGEQQFGSLNPTPDDILM